ncbi:unnamed protein product [Albugo candida]|uniref:Uncharacterized protein n=1 Tax=Albugo candida TaxID=65357 RepID=A0A024FUR0_9STRA|nr:unnamed protein product [Albugo candida]|eukprot:CCI10652.1 unnamed protein product [Albugo candida]
MPAEVILLSVLFMRGDKIFFQILCKMFCHHHTEISYTPQGCIARIPCHPILLIIVIFTAQYFSTLTHFRIQPKASFDCLTLCNLIVSSYLTSCRRLRKLPSRKSLPEDAVGDDYINSIRVDVFKPLIYLRVKAIRNRKAFQSTEGRLSRARGRLTDSAFHPVCSVRAINFLYCE